MCEVISAEAVQQRCGGGAEAVQKQFMWSGGAVSERWRSSEVAVYERQGMADMSGTFVWQVGLLLATRLPVVAAYYVGGSWLAGVYLSKTR